MLDLQDRLNADFDFIFLFRFLLCLRCSRDVIW